MLVQTLSDTAVDEYTVDQIAQVGRDILNDGHSTYYKVRQLGNPTISVLEVDCFENFRRRTSLLRNKLKQTLP